MNPKRKILIVEDEGTIARGLSDLLQSEGYATVVVGNGVDAVKRIPKTKPDLVLLDLNLPGIAGLEVCRQIRAQGFVHPVVMLTSRSEQVDKIIGLEAGADDYVTKPFDSRELLVRVRAHLRRHDRLPPSRSTGSPGSPSGGKRRKLLAIMFTDMKDFAKAMNRDEKHALKLLKIHNTKVQRALTRAGGKVIEVIGDAFLAAFESALRAVECAAVIQRELKEYNRHSQKQDHIRIRIGIHLGDVMEIDGKLRGDAINIAARLQQIAAPGHINVSEGVFDVVKGRTKMKTKSLGSRKVKNIKQPITVYRLSV
jgi:DNA-binding response OmpR family regulator